MFEHIPSIEHLLIVAPVSVFFGYVSLHIAGHIKAHGIRTPYTRKMVHVATFLAVAALHIVGGLEAVIAFGLGAGPVLLYAVYRGKGYILFEGIAREGDEPHRKALVLIPFLMTALGGLLGSYNFGELALYGYLVAGIGDAAGEPIGTRFGRHHFPSLFHLQSRKTVEGSIGVFVASLIALYVGGVALSISIPIEVLSIIAFAIVLVELLSPRGCDNVFMQLVPAYLIFLYL